MGTLSGAVSGGEGSVAGAGSTGGADEAASAPVRGVQGGREGDPFEEAEDEAVRPVDGTVCVTCSVFQPEDGH